MKNIIEAVEAAWNFTRSAVRVWQGRGPIALPENPSKKPAVKPPLTVAECRKTLSNPSSVKAVLQVIYELSNLVGKNEEAQTLIFQYILSHKDEIQAKTDLNKKIKPFDSLVCQELAHIVGKIDGENCSRKNEMLEILAKHESRYVRDAVTKAKKPGNRSGISCFSEPIEQSVKISTPISSIKCVSVKARDGIVAYEAVRKERSAQALRNTALKPWLGGRNRVNQVEASFARGSNNSFVVLAMSAIANNTRPINEKNPRIDAQAQSAVYIQGRAEAQREAALCAVQKAIEASPDEFYGAEVEFKIFSKSL
jgi:hypothetical protein